MHGSFAQRLHLGITYIESGIICNRLMLVLRSRWRDRRARLSERQRRSRGRAWFLT